MSLTKTEVQHLVNTYILAWTAQDVNLIATIFTEDALYHERVLAAPIRGRIGIQSYWQSKVVESQRDIRCELLNLYLDGDTAIAEWEVYFYDVPIQAKKRMREVAILELEDGKIAGLREYWSSELTSHC